MDISKVAKSNVDQALGAWVDYLNQVRIYELVSKLSAQDGNLCDNGVRSLCHGTEGHKSSVPLWHFARTARVRMDAQLLSRRSVGVRIFRPWSNQQAR